MKKVTSEQRLQGNQGLSSVAIEGYSKQREQQCKVSPSGDAGMFEDQQGDHCISSGVTTAVGEGMEGPKWGWGGQ